ncbi:MAG TPA: glycosyltransferase family 2 protein [Pirellulales bacterium]|nr:glycosyltransferase family 2 protein [Pirellulales bacterium]
MPLRVLTALPVYNEAAHVAAVLAEVRRYSPEVLVVDDGSRDGTAGALDAIEGLHRLTHAENRGYGAALRSAFDFAIREGYEILVTIDCDGQHEPRRIPRFVAACASWDIVSGSRYLKQYPGDSLPPADRRRINELLTTEINARLGLHLTDAFCGFKAYRVEALRRLNITENGYAMPLEVWVQAACAGLRIRELPVPLIYLSEERSFGGALDNSEVRLNHYRQVFERSLAAVCPEGCAG